MEDDVPFHFGGSFFWGCFGWRIIELMDNYLASGMFEQRQFRQCFSDFDLGFTTIFLGVHPLNFGGVTCHHEFLFQGSNGAANFLRGSGRKKPPQKVSVGKKLWGIGHLSECKTFSEKNRNIEAWRNESLFDGFLFQLRDIKENNFSFGWPMPCTGKKMYSPKILGLKLPTSRKKSLRMDHSCHSIPSLRMKMILIE